MEGAGVLTLVAALLVAPFELWQAHAQKRRLLSPHELNLRRATQPLGLLALLAGCAWLLGVRDVAAALAPVFLHPSDNLVLAVLPLAGLFYGVASFVTGAGRCWGVRSDGMLPVWAFFKLALGVGGLWLLRDMRGPSDDLAALFRLALDAMALWCAVVGGARFLLLSIGGGNALARVQRHIQQTQIVMRPVSPARLRPWWLFWKFW
jgi:hypothetical protein